MSRWTEILTADEIAAYHALTASIDPCFAAAEKAQYERYTASELRSAMHRAWLCAEDCRYQLARSYLALKLAEPKRYRIRRCNGNRDAWCLLAIRPDGTESEAHGSYTTALSLDALLANAGHLQPKEGDKVEFIP